MSAVVILSVNHHTILHNRAISLQQTKESKNRDITNVQKSYRTWRRNGFKAIHTKTNHFKRRRKLTENSYDQKNTQDPFIRTMLLNLVKLAKSWIGIMRAAQIRDQWNCRTSCTTSERRHLVSIGSVWTARKAGGKTPWSVTAIFEMCKTCWQMARHLVNVGSIYHLKSRLNHLEQKWNSIQYHQQTKVECISSARKSFLENSWDTRWTRWEVGLVNHRQWIRKISKQCHHREFT